MSNGEAQQPGASLGRADEELLAGVLEASNSAEHPQGLDLLVWDAARLGDQTTLRHLLANRGRCSFAPSKDDDEVWGGSSCLWVASMSGHAGAVKALLASGVEVDAARRENRGLTPLYIAAKEGHEGVIGELLKAGADVNKAKESLDRPRFTLLQKKATRAWLSGF